MTRRELSILVAPGAFKDTFAPVEACSVIGQAIETVLGRGSGTVIAPFPMVDGGEYSLETLLEVAVGELIEVNGVCDAAGHRKSTRYVGLKDGSAFIATSSVLRTSDAAEQLRNPENLTSYGLGQMIVDAYGRGFHRILLGMGGTHTVDGGIGMAQALGVQFLDAGGDLLKPANGTWLAGADMQRIGGVDARPARARFAGLQISAICDSQIDIAQVAPVIDQKIGPGIRGGARISCVQRLHDGLRSYASVVEGAIGAQGSRPIAEWPYYGVAGGVMLSAALCSDLTIEPGAEFFLSLFGFAKAVQGADLVVTGEGRLDRTSLLGKSPIGVARAAAAAGKDVVFICGSVSPEIMPVGREICRRDLPAQLRDAGIVCVIDLSAYFQQCAVPDEEANRLRFFRRETAAALTTAFTHFFETAGD